MPKDISEFAGRWVLSREIEDSKAQRQGALDGFAVFRDAEDDALEYQETGVLRFEGQPDLTAARRYLWQQARGSDVVKISFEDGAPFHDFALSRTMPEAQHHCAPDMYHVTYDFAAWPKWSSTWRVQGPRKDYRMVSRYRREA